MAEALVNGVGLAYQQLGEGPDVVLVHGLAANRAFWFGQYALPLSRHHRVTLFDLRGHGYSQRSELGYSSTALSQDLEALLDHLQIDRCRLVGHSYGGSVALELACRQPSRVAGLCLMDAKINALQATQRLADLPTLSPFEQEVSRRSGIDWSAEEQIGLRYLEIVAQLQLSADPLPMIDAVTPFGEGRGARRSARAWLDLIQTPGVRDELLRPGATSETIRRQLRELPLLLLYGEQSRCKPSCEALRALLPQSQVAMIEEAGHFFPISHASTVLPVLNGFLAANHTFNIQTAHVST